MRIDPGPTPAQKYLDKVLNGDAPPAECAASHRFSWGIGGGVVHEELENMTFSNALYGDGPAVSSPYFRGLGETYGVVSWQPKPDAWMTPWDHAKRWLSNRLLAWGEALAE